MGSPACIEHRCSEVTSQKTGYGQSRCTGNSKIEYWKAKNDASLKLSDMKFSNGEKNPPCNSHSSTTQLIYPIYEELAIGQQTCNGYRAGKGTDISAKNDLELISCGVSSFVDDLYTQINIELSARMNHKIYEGLSCILSDAFPTNGTIISTNCLNDALSVISSFYNQLSSDLTANFAYQAVSSENTIKLADFVNLKNEFNRSVVQECICYSDCNEYSVCYCYGNCNYY